ncbi:hypothetical protein BGX31_004624 [Mortierella sp. GBA43]|nr:hypothetical protein BGX31_004624 [Mortierella sp. GBA43]
MTSFSKRILRLDRFEPDRIVTSNIVRPRTLVFIRVFGFIYVLAATISVWATIDNAVDYFKYFTHLAYFGLMAYLFVSTHIRDQPALKVVTYSVFVPIVFWGLLAWDRRSWTPLKIYQNVSEHAMDGVFGAIVELIFNRHFLEPVHSLVVATVMILYMLLTFVIYAIYGVWYRNMLLISHSAKVNGGHEWESQESDQSRNGNSTEEALAEESV